ncbi:MAG: hypothetical protein KDB80_01295 [Planctomycetes bacterium]|nr:hypothetical protein [Planctomycetota bacterium]
MGKAERLECPHCGAIFRRGRLACPECGSDAETGWRDSEDIDYLSVELPDDTVAESTTSVWRLIAVAAAILAAAALVYVTVR